MMEKFLLIKHQSVMRPTACVGEARTPLLPWEIDGGYRQPKRKDIR